MEDNARPQVKVRRLKSVKRKTLMSFTPTEEIRLENVVGVTVINNASISTSSSGTSPFFSLDL